MEPWLRRPTAWLPFAVSFAALALVVGVAATAGVDPHEDEGAPARLFQVLMLIDVLLVTVFVGRWLPRAPRAVIAVAAAQALGALIPIAAVLLLERLG